MRRRPLLTTCLLLLCSLARAGDALFPVPVDGKWGFIDKTGKVVITPSLDALGHCVRRVFTTDLAPVKRDGKWVYIDRAGKVVLRVAADLPVRDGGPFVEGLARVSVGRIRLGDIGRITTGYIDRTGAFVIPPRFVAARDFSDGLAAVRLPPRRGCYVDKTGKVIVKDCGYAYDFKDGRALVRLDGAAGGQWGLIDKTGKMTVKFPKAERVRPFSEGLAAFFKPPKWGYLDRSGKVVVKPQFHFAEDFHDGCASVWSEKPAPQPPKKRNRFECRFIDKSGKFVTAQAFDAAFPFRDGRAAVQVGGKWGYLDTRGELAVPARFDSAGPFAEGLAAVKADGKVVYIDPVGKVAVQPKDKVVFGAAFNQGLAPVHLPDGRRGYIDKAGRLVYAWTVAQPVFDD